MEENIVGNPVTINSQQSPPTSDAGPAPLGTNPEKPKPKFSIAAIIGTILFLLVAGGAAASLTVLKPQLERLVSTLTPTPTQSVAQTPTPTPDPTANWKTFEGDGYIIKYPTTWIDLTSQNSNKPLFSNNDKNSYVSIEIDNTSSAYLCGSACQNATLQEFLDVNNKVFWHLGNMGGGGPGTTFEQAELVTIGGKNAVKQTNHVTTNYEQTKTTDITTDYYIPLPDFPKKMVVLRFNYSNIQTDSNNSTNLIEQILSTFKFTENSADYQLLMEQQDAKTRNTLVEFSNANIRYYATHAGFPWSTTGPCQSSTTAAPRGTSLSQMIPCISLLIEEGELKSSFLSANGQSISKIFINSSGSELNMCYKPSSIKEQQEPKTIYDSYGKVDRSCVSTGNMCFWCTGI